MNLDNTLIAEQDCPKLKDSIVRRFRNLNNIQSVAIQARANLFPASLRQWNLTHEHLINY